MKTTLSDGGLLLKEDFFTLNIIIIIIYEKSYKWKERTHLSF